MPQVQQQREEIVTALRSVAHEIEQRPELYGEITVELRRVRYPTASEIGAWADAGCTYAEPEPREITHRMQISIPIGL